MLRVHVRRVRSPLALPEWPRNSVQQQAAPAAGKGGGSPAQTVSFPSRFLLAAGRSNPSPPLSESAGSLPGSMDGPPRSAEIRSASSTLPAAEYFPAATPAAAPRALPAASNAPDPPASAGNQMRLLSLPLPLLRLIHTPSAAAQESPHPPAWSRGERPAPRLPASSSR